MKIDETSLPGVLILTPAIISGKDRQGANLQSAEVFV
jgi:hypothetical protein